MTTSSRLSGAGRKGLVALVAASAITAALPAAAPAKTRKITCKLDLFATIPQPAPTAANFGTSSCGKPFGFGVQKDSSTVTRSSLTTGLFEGPFKMFFDTGTIKGTFKIAFVTTLAPPVPPATLPTIAGVVYTGTVAVTGGTGAWRRIRGTGTVTGTSPDAKRTSLTETLTLRGFRTAG
jgi:hypothetical protein